MSCSKRRCTLPTASSSAVSRDTTKMVAGRADSTSPSLVFSASNMTVRRGLRRWNGATADAEPSAVDWSLGGYERSPRTSQFHAEPVPVQKSDDPEGGGGDLRTLVRVSRLVRPFAPPPLPPHRTTAQEASRRRPPGNASLLSPCFVSGLAERRTTGTLSEALTQHFVLSSAEVLKILTQCKLHFMRTTCSLLCKALFGPRCGEEENARVF